LVFSEIQSWDFGRNGHAGAGGHCLGYGGHVSVQPRRTAGNPLSRALGPWCSSPNRATSGRFYRSATPTTRTSIGDRRPRPGTSATSAKLPFTTALQV
jgi:hypothetical protein